MEDDLLSVFSKQVRVMVTINHERRLGSTAFLRQAISNERIEEIVRTHLAALNKDLLRESDQDQTSP